MMIISTIIAWFAARKIAFLLYGVIAAGLVAGAFGLVQHGKSIARAECDAAAKQSRIEALERDLANVTERMRREAAAVASLRKQQADDAVRIGDLSDELKNAKLQSTAPGAKKDANALLDDQCNYTERGARRVRE